MLLEYLPSMHLNTSARKSPINQFGVLYKKYLYIRLRDPAFGFLREAFEDYLKKRYTGGRVSRLRPFIGKDSMEIATQCTYVTLDQVMQLLGVSHQNLHTLISRGVIGTIKKPRGTKGKDRLWLIEKVEAEKLHEEWKDLLSLDDLVRNYLGVSKQQVYALTKADLLHPVRGRDLDRSNIRYYKRGDLERLKAQLLQYADKDLPSTSEYIPLSKSTKRIGLPLVEILKEILVGHLVVIDTERDIPLFQRLALSDSEGKRFREERLRAQRSDLNLLTASEVMKSLGVGHGTLRELVRQGVLEGERVNGKIHGYLFQREMVDSFRRSYVFTKEAAEILDVHSNTIYKYVSRGILHPVGLSRFQRFLREEVEALTSPDTLSIP
jgi:excisionase family DNA binding protein